mmetsp:Transcript_60527/g.91290  ORF Transcript_60527/g.91290 Transcript_60527/m.91290 type:complete len:311 (-) Transcript_60527:69-1001(-)
MDYGATTEQQPTSDEVPLAHAEPKPEDTEELSDEEKRANCIKKSIVAAVLVVFVGFIVADSLTNKYIADGIQTFLEWIEANPGPGVLVFIFVYFGATVLFVPGSILTLGAGFVFANSFGLATGVVLGVLSVFVGASAGAIAAFLLGRFLLRDWVTGLTKKYAIFEALDNAFEEKGFRIMALLRLSPIVPFNAINYIAGVTAISFWAYFWALIAILPGTTLYVFLGASAGSLTDSAMSGDNATVTVIVVVVGIVFGFAAVAATSYYAKQELNKVTARREEEQGEPTDHDAEIGIEVPVSATEAKLDQEETA